MYLPEMNMNEYKNFDQALTVLRSRLFFINSADDDDYSGGSDVVCYDGGAILGLMAQPCCKAQGLMGKFSTDMYMYLQ